MTVDRSEMPQTTKSAGAKTAAPRKAAASKKAAPSKKAAVAKKAAPTKSAAASKVPTLRVGDVDGVTALWLPQPGPQLAMLRFRVGTADETLTTHGVTHLVEHLALHAFARAKLEYNGWVGVNTTTFAASGSRADLQGFIRDVCAALRALPLDRLAEEVRILKTEAAQRPGGILDHALSARFGAEGYGLSWWDELGFDALTADDVQAHADRYFTAENAVLMLSGSPTGYRAELPAGERHSLPAAVEYVSTPAWHGAYDDTAVGATWVSERNAANSLFLNCVETRLMDRLRHEESLVYSVNTHGERVGENSHFYVGSKVLTEHRVEAANTFVEVLRDTVDERPIEKSEITTLKQKARRSLSASAPGTGWLDFAGDDYLCNGVLRQPAERVEETLAVTVDDVQAVAERGAETRLWFLPDGASTKGLDRVERRYSPDGPKKTAFTSRAFFDGERATVAAGSEGITHTFGDRSITYAWADVAASIDFDTGRQVLVHRNGATLNFEPKRWSKEAQLRRMIADSTLPGRRITLVDETPPEKHIPAPPFTIRAAINGVVDGLLAAFTFLMLLVAISLLVDMVTQPSGDAVFAFIVGIVFAGAPGALLLHRRGIPAGELMSLVWEKLTRRKR